MPYPIADGRDYALFPRAYQKPNPLANAGKLYTRLSTGAVNLFYLTDTGVEYALTPSSQYTSPVVIWRPGVPSSGDAVETWAEVEAIIASNLGNVTVNVDTQFIGYAPAVIPATASTECFGSTRLVSFNFNDQGLSRVQVADGGQLKNLSILENVWLFGAPTIRPFLVLNKNFFPLLARFGGQIGIDLGATVPGVQVDGFFAGFLGILGSTIVNQSGNPALSVFNVADGVFAIFAVFANFGSGPPPNYPANSWSGGPTVTILRIWDASAAPVAQPNYLGAFVDVPADYALGVQYQDSSVTPASAFVTVQGGIDYMKRLLLGSGATAGRPAIADVAIGAMYYDTDLTIPVWSDGAVWRDAAGAPA